MTSQALAVSCAMLLSAVLCYEPACSQTVEDVTTSSPCSPVIGSVTGTVLIDCSAMGLGEIPVYSSYIATKSFSEENADLMEFLQEHMHSVVFLRLRIDDTRLYLSMDSFTYEEDLCSDASSSVFEEDGMRLKQLSLQQYESYISFNYPDKVNMSQDEFEKFKYDLFEQLYEYCSEAALSIEASNVRELVDRGYDLSGFFYVNDTGGHLTRPIIRLEERSASNVELQVAGAVLDEAESAREARSAAFEAQAAALTD